jgi:methyl coenzyme M reductase alpha subunit
VEEMTTKRQQKEFLKAMKQKFSEDKPKEKEPVLNSHPTILVGGV